MRLLSFGLTFLLALPAFAQADAPVDEAGTRRAVLVGINYEGVGPRNLPGTDNDVRIMRGALERRGFSPANVDVLTHGGARRARILDAVRGMIDASSPGDHLVFYYAGHGVEIDTTLLGDTRLQALVPVDVEDEGVILDKELRQLWNGALDVVQRDGAGGSLTLVFDNCHSGSIDRGDGATSRLAEWKGYPVPVPAGDLGEPPSTRGALVFSASQDFESAKEKTIPGVGERHGVFTWAFVETLDHTPFGAEASLVFGRLRSLMRAVQGGQEPSLSGPRAAPLFGEPSAPFGAAGIAVEAVDVDGTVRLAGGAFVGLAPGARLVRFLSASGVGSPVRLIVTDSLGVTQTRAQIDTNADVEAVCIGAGGRTEALRSRCSGERALVAVSDTVRVGDLFEITEAVPFQRPVLFWVPEGRPVAEVLALAGNACSSSLCSDVIPDSSPTAVAAVELPDGRVLSRGSARRSGVVYRPLPPTRSLRSQLVDKLTLQPRATLHDVPEEADYWLAGALTEGGGVVYRWVRRESAMTGAVLSETPVHENRWAIPYDESHDDLTADFLGQVAAGIVRSTQWLWVESPSAEAFPVRALGIVRDDARDGPVLVPDPATGSLTMPPSEDPAREGVSCRSTPDQCYRLVFGLTEEDYLALREAGGDPLSAPRQRRYAYAFMTNPEGGSCLWFPSAGCDPSATIEGGENALELDPRDLSNLRPLPTSDGGTVYAYDLGTRSRRFLDSQPPFGRNVVYFLTTEEPLSNPERLIWGAAVSEDVEAFTRDRSSLRGEDGEDDAAADPVPTWSLQTFWLDVVEAADAPDGR